MPRTVEIADAQATLSEIIASLGPNDEVVIVHEHRPVARIVSTRKAQARFGSCKDMLTIFEDDDEHLNDFKKHMS